MELAARWLHVLGAVTWLGGMLFIALVLVPVARGVQDPRLRADLISQSGRRFRTVGWIALAVLVVTGIANLYFHPWMLRAPAFHVKAALVLLALGLSVLHDFVLGPRAIRLPADVAGPPRRASWIARLNLLIVLLIVLLGLALRG
ncbi:MAG: DUF4149 domain-containing protein [Candidatus Rokubacteria bacterium]|nr:DUF4149 domain-containing protein [Candidatus Rokubacteria bacterium]